jgi:hypothetical protein
MMHNPGDVVLIFWGTLRRKRLSLLWFALAAGAFHWLVAVSFPAIGGTEAVTSVVRTLPEGLRSSPWLVGLAWRSACRRCHMRCH